MLLQQLVNGLTIGCVYALVTIGFSMVWSILQLTNLAHSSFYILGPYLTLYLMRVIGVSIPGFFVSIVLCSSFTAMLGAGMDRICLRPIRERYSSNIATMLCTVGVQSIIINSIIVIFGSESKSFPNVLNWGRFSIGNAVVSYLQIAILILAFFLMAIMSFIVYRTKLGVAMRAVAQNTSASHLMGINVNFVIMVTFFLGTLIAAIAGSMVGTYYQAIDTNMALVIGSKAMAAAILGGIGFLPGAMLGGIIIGVIETLVAGYISSGYRDAIAFAILILVILIRPTGMFGKKAIKKV
jgi:branched-chain amino acid transport system permease protein